MQKAKTSVVHPAKYTKINSMMKKKKVKIERVHHLRQLLCWCCFQKQNVHGVTGLQLEDRTD